MMATEVAHEAVLELRGVSKRFAGTVALDHIDFAVQHGEIHALLGENGAGKSTLIKIITGSIPPDSGELRVRGQSVSFGAPRDAAASGITALPQDVVAVPQLSVGRNVLLGLERMRARVDALTAGEAERVQWALHQVGATFSPRVKARELSPSNLRLLQIARLMLHVGDIVVMDEPTAVLSEPEAENLLRHLISFRNHGKAIVYVTHRLSEVMQVADRATILRDGRHVGQLERRDFDRTRIVGLMARQARSEIRPRAATVRSIDAPASAPSENAVRALDIANLSATNRFSEVSFFAERGQIVGLAGIQGAGHADILRALAGVEPWRSGEVKIFGRPLQSGSIQSAVNEGMLLVPADRRKAAILPKMSIQENLAVSRRVRISCRRFGIRSLGEERRMSSDHIRALSIAPPRNHALAGELSGGNQQKVALARVLESDARILLLDEPTQGIDVRAKAEIHDLLRQAAKQGCVILVASSEFEELVALAHTIHVMRLGRLTRTLPAASTNYREVLHWALP